MNEKQQLNYEFARAQYNVDKKLKHDAVRFIFSWKVIFHILCSTYGWTIDYVGDLNSRQVRLILDGRKEYDEFINSIKEDRSDQDYTQSRSSIPKDHHTKKVRKKMRKPSVSAQPSRESLPGWESADDMLSSGMFSVVKKQKRKKKKKK